MRFHIFTSLVGLAISVRTVSRTQGWETHFREYMDELETTASSKGIRARARGKLFKSQGESKGLVLMQHGFTATPFFYFLIWGPLVKAGWDVMIPLFPGHGRVPTLTANGSGYKYMDYLEDLPTRGSGYSRYGDKLIELAHEYAEENSGKQMVLVGCSHGGALAAYVAMRSGAGFWNRVLLLNPFLAPPLGLAQYIDLDFIKDWVPQFLQSIGLFRERFGWGEECEQLRWPNRADKGEGTTGGICQFKPENLQGVFEFALNVEGEMRSRAANDGIFSDGIFDVVEGVDDAWSNEGWAFGTSTRLQATKVQLIATEEDSAVSNLRIHNAAKAMEKGLEKNKFGYCVYAKEFEHTFVNPIDKEVDMWWLDRSQVKGAKTPVDRIVEFVDDGALFPTRGQVTEDSALRGDPSCDIDRQ